jgi:hypothetical protein
MNTRYFKSQFLQATPLYCIENILDSKNEINLLKINPQFLNKQGFLALF